MISRSLYAQFLTNAPIMQTNYSIKYKAHVQCQNNNIIYTMTGYLCLHLLQTTLLHFGCQWDVVLPVNCHRPNTSSTRLSN